MVAAMALEKSSDVTIYGMNCMFCDFEFDFNHHLVMRMVNDHDEIWDYGKNSGNYSAALKDIKISGNLLEDTKRIFIEEGDSLECKVCGKYFDILDQLLGHVVTEHEGIFKGNKFLLASKFLNENGFVEDDEDCWEYDENPKKYDEPPAEEIGNNNSFRNIKKTA